MIGTGCSTAISSCRYRSRRSCHKLRPVTSFVIFRLTAYLLAPFYLGALLWRGRREAGIWRGIAQRFGFGAPLPAPVWLHAASVGEVQAAAILVAALRAADAQLPLLVTATTAAGLARARALFEPIGISVRYVPLDLPGSVRRFLGRVQPRAAVILETEIWPNLFQGLRRDARAADTGERAHFGTLRAALSRSRDCAAVRCCAPSARLRRRPTPMRDVSRNWVLPPSGSPSRAI